MHLCCQGYLETPGPEAEAGNHNGKRQAGLCCTVMDGEMTLPAGGPSCLKRKGIRDNKKKAVER